MMLRIISFQVLLTLSIPLFYQGKVPIDLKRAKVTPIYKKGSKTQSGNYRPVSVLSIASKVLERVIYNQVYDYIQSNGLFYELQSGFRKSYSTDSCLTHLTDYIKCEIDQGNYCGMVMLDLQKAFDTVNHDILLFKLKALGFNTAVVNWMHWMISHWSCTNGKRRWYQLRTR